MSRETDELFDKTYTVAYHDPMTKQEVPAAELGASLRETREKLDISLRKAALTAEISAAYLSQLELGTVRDPSPRVLYELAKIYARPLHLPVDVLYARFMSKAGYVVPIHPMASLAAPVDDDDEAIRTDDFRFNGSSLEGSNSNIGLQLTAEESAALAEYLSWYRWRHGRSE